MLLRLLFLGTVSLIFLADCATSLAVEKGPPNIILIFIDDMGWGDFSCFGNTEAQTPNVDSMAAEGIRFSQFYVNSPICSPSRCAISTGQFPARWRITSYLNNRADNARRGMANWLDPTAPTLAHILQSHGYATGHFGKWHLGGQRDVDDAPPITAYGFDESLTNFEGMGPKLLPLTLKPGDKQFGRIWENAEILGGPVIWMPRSQITGGYVNAALAFIKRAIRAGKPFYVNVWPDDVHAPYWPSVGKWGDGNRQQLYRAVLEEMDQQLGPLFQFIRTKPDLRDNTLILICSDNGPDANGGSSGPFRGSKATLYEGGIRSPLVVWGPGLIAEEAVGSWNKTSVFSAIDLVPSLLEIAGVSTPSEVTFDGENLAPVLLGKSTNSRKAALFWRRPPDRKFFAGTGPYPDLAIREGDWKLLCDYDGSRPELYDLSSDPGETRNLAEQNPEMVKRLTQLLLAWQESMPQDNGPAIGKEALRTGNKERQ